MNKDFHDRTGGQDPEDWEDGLSGGDEEESEYWDDPSWDDEDWSDPSWEEDGEENYGRAAAGGAERRAAPRRRVYSPKTDPQSAENESFGSKMDRLRAEVAGKKRRRKRIIAMAVAECVVLAAIFSYAYVSRMWNLMPKPSVDKENVQNPNIPVETVSKMKGYWLIAVFGLDSGTNDTISRGNRSDVNMIACVNQDTGEVKLVSLYRDTYMKIGDNDYRKFNMAYSTGGPEQALKMINENLDLNITEYITFNWKAVADGINILGGIDLEITKSEFKFINAFISETVQETGVGSYQLKAPGMNHLDGIQAVAYGRLRLMDNDYKRTERQRKVIELVAEKAKAADYAVLNQILVVCLEQVMTNLTFEDLTSVALNAQKYYISETAGFPFDKGEANLGGNRGACVIPKTLESNVSQLHQFFFGDENYVPTDAVKKISQKIASDSGVYAAQTKATAAAGSSSGQKSTTEASGEKTTEETETGTGEEEKTTEETDENGMVVLPPGIGETDENGELIDPPEPEDPNDPWYGGGSPGSRPGETSYVPYPGYEEDSPGSPGESSPDGYTGTGPARPGDETEPAGPDSPGQSAAPGGNGSLYPGESFGPGGSGGGTDPVGPGSGSGENTGGPGSGGGNIGGPRETDGANTGGTGAYGPGGSSGGSSDGPGGSGASGTVPGPGDSFYSDGAAGPG